MKTALVVEDCFTTRQVMTQCLENVGMLVVGASSVEEAEGKITQKQPDIIFLDVILPGKSGFEFCRALKEDPHTKQIPVVMCSTKGTDVDKVWGTMLGADDYLAKPVEEEDIKQALQRLI